MDESARRPRRPWASPWLFDGALALAAAGLTTSLFADLVGGAEPALPRDVAAVGYALVLLYALPLAARRRFP